MNQPDPIPNNLQDTQEIVIEDLKARWKLGIERYGTGLQPFNGRNSLQDLYEELADALVYCKNEMRKQDSHETALKMILDFHDQGVPAWQLAEIAFQALNGWEFESHEDDEEMDDCCGQECGACDE